jgi:RHS repeat-associated protein
VTHASRARHSFVVLAVLTALSASAPRGTDARQQSRAALTARVAPSAAQPIAFEANMGQAAPEARFIARAGNMHVTALADELVFSVAEAAESEPDAPAQPTPLAGHQPKRMPKLGTPTHVRMRLRGINPQAQIVGRDRLPGVSHYLIGNDPAKWHRDVPHYARVEYQNVYPGVSLSLYSKDGQLEYDFDLAPGADPSAIDMEFEGMNELRTTPEGDLVLKTPHGAIRHLQPKAFERGAGRDAPEQPVHARFHDKGGNHIGFALDGGRKARHRRIDPTVVYQSVMNGSDVVFTQDIAVNARGEAYIAGGSCAPDLVGVVRDHAPQSQTLYPPSYRVNAFVTKLDANGQVLFTSFIGGNEGASANSVGLDSTGQIYLSGPQGSHAVETYPGEVLFPGGAAGHHYFVIKLSADGKDLLFSRGIGPGWQWAGVPKDWVQESSMSLTAMKVDPRRNVLYVGGTVANFCWEGRTSFPCYLFGVWYGVCDQGSGVLYFEEGTEAFVEAFSMANGAPLGLRFLGTPTDHDSWPPQSITDLALDAAGNVYATGARDPSAWCGGPPTLTQTPSHFPVTPGAYSNLDTSGPPSIAHAFVVKLDSQLNVVYSATLGPGFGTAIDVDNSGNAYVAGFTHSLAFPVTPGAAQTGPRSNTGTSAFVSKLNRTGSALVYSTYYRGENYDRATNIVVDDLGHAIVLGASLPSVSPGYSEDWLGEFDTDGKLLDEYTLSGTERWLQVPTGDGTYWLLPQYDYAFGGVTLGDDGTIYATTLHGPFGVQTLKFEGTAGLIDPSEECCPVIGGPVNIYTGNVWLQQVDGSLPGWASPTVFQRSYNSLSAAEGRSGPLGRGWTHSYDRRIERMRSGRVRLIEGNGVPTIFEDRDGDGVLEAAIPSTDKSRFTPYGNMMKRVFPDGTEEVYDESLRLFEIYELPSIVTELYYTGDNLTMIQQWNGTRQFDLSYDAQDRITQLKGPAGVIASYAYDDAGDLTTVTYADGSGYGFRYDENGQLTEVTDATGRIVESHTYSGHFGLTSTAGGGQEKMTLAYEPGRTTVTDANGSITVWEWTEIAGMKVPTSRTGPCATCGGGGNSESWSYYPDGQVHVYTNGNNETTTYTYNDHGDVETVTDSLQRTTHYAYTYNDSGRMLTKVRTAPGRATTTWTYGEAGVESIAEDIGDSQPRTTRFTYNGAKVATATDAEGRITNYTYNDAGDLLGAAGPGGAGTAVFTYDEMGWMRTRADGAGDTTRMDYDARGRVTRVTYPDHTHVDYAYDKRGLRTGVLDTVQRGTSYGYDDDGRLTSVLDPARGLTRYEYDPMSHMTAITDARNQRTQFDYDAQGRLWHTIYPGGRIETLSYDAAGRLWTKTDRKSVTTTFGYDGGGRLSSKSYSDGTPAVTYGYDEADRMLSASNGTDTLGMTYDVAGRLLTEASTLNSTSLTYTYDQTDRRQNVSLGGTEMVGYHYDPAGRLDKVLRGSAEFGFSYDAADRRQQMTYPNGLNTIYNYDALSRLTAVGAGQGNVATTEFHYGYDAVGNRTSKTALGYAETYGYDDLDRLTSAVRTGAGAGNEGFGYDAVGNRQSSSGNGVTTGATYNMRNELTARDSGGPTRFLGALNEPGTVTVNGQPAAMLAGNVFEAQVPLSDGSNTVHVQARDASGNVSTQDYQVNVTPQHEGYTYDLNGNLETKTEGSDTWHYYWSAENQLVRVEKNSVELARFSYDPLGRRVRKIAGGVTVSYVYDGQDILRETRSDGTTYTYVHGPGIDEPLARVDGSGAIAYYHADGLGSIVKMTDQSGATLSNRLYDTWGNLQLGADQPGYAFTGREWDPEINLYYYRARYYDPKAGRFISEDPTQAGDYGYAADNPAVFTDPTGLYIVLAGEGWPKVLRLMQALLGPSGRGLLGTMALGEKRQVVGCLGAMRDAGGFGPLLATMIASDKRLEIEMAPSMSSEYEYVGTHGWDVTTTPAAQGGAFVIGAEESLKGYTQLIMGPEAADRAEAVNQGLLGASMSSDGRGLAYTMERVLAHELGHAYGNMMGLPVRGRNAGTNLFALVFENLERSMSHASNFRILHDPVLFPK